MTTQRLHVHLVVYRDLVRTYEHSRSCHTPDVVAASQRLDSLVVRCLARTQVPPSRRKDRVAAWLCTLLTPPGTAETPTQAPGTAHPTRGRFVRRLPTMGSAGT